MEVRLTSSEQAMAEAVATLFQQQARKRGAKDTRGLKTTYKESLAVSKNALGGEVAVANYLGRFWNGGGMGTGDVGDVQVKTTTYPNGKLTIPDNEADDTPMVLVTGRMPNYVIRGWIYAGDGRKVGKLDDMGHPERPPVMTVTQDRLRPIEELRRIEWKRFVEENL